MSEQMLSVLSFTEKLSEPFLANSVDPDPAPVFYSISVFGSCCHLGINGIEYKICKSNWDVMMQPQDLS